MEEPVQSGERRIEALFPAEPKIIMGYHKPPPPAFTDHVFDVIEYILSHGRMSRLFKALVDEKHLAEKVQTLNGLPGDRYPNQFVLFATPRSPYGCVELESAMNQEIERLKQESMLRQNPNPLSRLPPESRKSYEKCAKRRRRGKNWRGQEDPSRIVSSFPLHPQRRLPFRN